MSDEQNPPRRRPNPNPDRPPRRRPEDPQRGSGDPRRQGDPQRRPADPQRRPADPQRRPADPQRRPADARRRQGDPQRLQREGPRRPSAGQPAPRRPQDPQRPRRDDPRSAQARRRPGEGERRPREGEQRPQRRPEPAAQRRSDPRPEPRQRQAPRRRPEPARQPETVYDQGEYDGDYEEYYDEVEWVERPSRASGVFLVVGILLVALLCVGGYVAFGDQIRDFVDGGADDYAGSGNGTEILISIVEGDTGADVAQTLYDAGVTKSFDALYSLLLADDVTFQPGTYSLEGEMSAQSVINAFRDPTTRVTNRVLIPEGLSAQDTFARLAEASEIPLSEFEAAAADYVALGVPAEAPSIEGFLFPATYELEPDSTAAGLVKTMVDKMIAQLDEAGIAPEDRFETVTLASIIQREAGSVDEDFFKVSRVFHNRLDEGMRLQSDATVAYGRGHYDSVFTTAEERADASNPYNTYALDGLPAGPIGLPGNLAIEAAAEPVDGPWLYFVTVNLETGETKFSETLDEHNQAVQQLQDWCHASEENQSYCG